MLQVPCALSHPLAGFLPSSQSLRASSLLLAYRRPKSACLCRRHLFRNKSAVGRIQGFEGLWAHMTLLTTARKLPETATLRVQMPTCLKSVMSLMCKHQDLCVVGAEGGRHRGDKARCCVVEVMGVWELPSNS